MELGEKIFMYRMRKNLSQGDLAELVEVSRQSVSKWETGASVPELDKLVRLCEVFEITLDELVRAEPESQASAEPPPSSPTEPPQADSQPNVREDRWHRTAGLILVCTGAIIFLLIGILFAQVLEGLVLTFPFILCGLVCLLFKKHIGLWCAWVLYFCASVYCVSMSGVKTTSFIWYMIYYSILDGITVGILISLALFAFYIAVAVATVMRFRHRVIPLTRRTVILSVAGGVVWLFLTFAMPMLISGRMGGENYLTLRWLSAVSFVLDWIATVIAMLLLTTYVPHLLAWRRRRKENKCREA